MNSIDRDVMYVQNSAVAASILWKFVCGYYNNGNRPVPFPLLFVILPIVFRKDLCDVIKSTQKGSGISKVSEKLFDNKENDYIHYVNNASIQMRELTVKAFNVAVEADLISLSFETATVTPLDNTYLTQYTPRGDCKAMLASAEKLGVWCSELTLLEISKWLKVRF